MTENQVPLSFLSGISSTSDKIWLHRHLPQHPSFGIFKIILPLLLKRINIENYIEIFVNLQSTVIPLPISKKRILIPFSLVHNDICNHPTALNISGSRCYVSFIDDCTQVTWISLLKQKLDVSNVFQNLTKWSKLNQVLSPFFQKKKKCIILEPLL